MTSAVKGEFGNNGACFKAPDPVKIWKVSRRWDGEEGKEDCRDRENSRCQAHGGRKHCIVEKLRQAHIPRAPRTSTLHRVLAKTRGDDGECADTGEAVGRVPEPSLVGSAARHRMHGAGNWASGGSPGHFVCALLDER